MSALVFGWGLWVHHELVFRLIQWIYEKRDILVLMMRGFGGWKNIIVGSNK